VYRQLHRETNGLGLLYNKLIIECSREENEN
jgi:hypothetical protein